MTARYHDLDAAIADGFILLHDCEVRPGEDAVGVLCIHLGLHIWVWQHNPNGMFAQAHPGISCEAE